MEVNKQIVDLTGIDVSDLVIIVTNWFLWYLPKILGAILVLWIWFKFIKIIEKWISKIMTKQKISPMLKTFVISLSNILLKIMVIIAAAWILWVQTSSFVAMIAAAWFAVGMALSWTLQNFAWWVMILLLKPFKIWDYVEIWDYSGSVKEINIFNSTLLTPDKKKIIIPNSDISNWAMINYSAEPNRRLDFVIWVSYEDNIDIVKETLTQIYKEEKRAIKKQGLTLWIIELADNSVNFNFRFYVKSTEYWSTKYFTLEKIKKTFDEKGISFPFPQRDVHLYKEK
jgi:small conductance mechanosensitive channel